MPDSKNHNPSPLEELIGAVIPKAVIDKRQLVSDWENEIEIEAVMFADPADCPSSIVTIRFEIDDEGRITSIEANAYGDGPHPYPEDLEDCMEELAWIFERKLGIVKPKGA